MIHAIEERAASVNSIIRVRQQTNDFDIVYNEHNQIKKAIFLF